MPPPFCLRAALFVLASMILAPCFLGANTLVKPSISAENWSRLEAGEAVVLSGSEGKERKALAAVLVPYPAPAVWRVIEDKEGAVHWCEGLREARVTETGENYSLVYQEMKVCFLPGTFKYVIRHTESVPQRRVDFKRESGSFKMLEGYWELYPVAEGTRTLLLYQLAVDPGIPVPARVVKDSLEKSLPEALVSLREQVALGESARIGAVPQ